MSRIAKKPIELPKGVELSINNQTVTAKGSIGNLSIDLHQSVQAVQEDGVVRMSPVTDDKKSMAMAGTMRSLVNNMVVGVSVGFEKKLELIGVGYRAAAQGNKLNLTLGFSHPVNVDIPDGIKVETPSQTEIIVKGADKQLVGQVAADIRAWRPPEPYKGKGVRYSDEYVVRKEAKKK